MISYQKLFDFDGLEKKFGTLDAEYQKFVKNTADGSNIVKQAITSYTKDLSDLLRELRTLNTAQAGSNRRFEEQAERAAASTKRLEELRGIIATLTDAQNANGVSIDKLKGSIDLLKKEYDQLDPKQNDFKQKQKEIADKVKLAKQAIDAQNTTLKAANQTLGGVINTYTKLSKQTNELRNQLRNLDGAFDLATGKINKNNKEAVALMYTIQQNDAALKRMDASMGIHSRKVGDYGQAWSAAKSDLLAFVGITTVVDTTLRALTATFEIITTFDRYRAVIKFASDSTAQFNQNLKFMSDLADETGTDIEVLYTKFGSFAIAAKNANFTTKETRDLFQSIIKAGGAYKMSNEAVALSLKAVEQIMNKNKLSMEEISQQLGDHMPGALGLFAQGLGVSVEKLTQMIKNGELFAKETLPKFAANLEKAVGKEAQNNVNTITGSWNRLTNQAKQFADELGQDTKVQGFFSRLNNLLADSVKKIREFLQVMRMATSTPPSSVGAFQEFEKMNAEDRAGRIAVLERSIAENEKILAGQTSRIYSPAQIKRIEEQNEKLKGTLAVYKRTNEELKKTEAAKLRNDAADKSSIKTLEDLNKKIEANQKLLEEGLLKNSNYLKTVEGAAIKRTLDELRKQKNKIEVAKGEGQPKKVKEVDTEYEKLIKELGKTADILTNDIIKDFKNGKPLVFPEKAVESWKKFYKELEAISKKLGIDIPDNLEKLNEKVDPIGSAKNMKRRGSVMSIQELLSDIAGGKIKPLSDTFTSEQSAGRGSYLNATSTADQKSGMSSFINLTKEQGFEALKLHESFSRSLRGLKEKDRDVLIALQQEIFDAQKANDKEREAAAKAHFDAERERILAERDLRRQVAQEAFNVAATIEKGISDLRTAYRNNQISALEKQKENEIKLAGDNAEAKEAIEKRTDEQIRQIRIKQAKADKQSALFSIALNTAQAVMSVLSTGGGTRFADFGISAGILTALVAANGLAQAALVLAQPLPAFKKGTQNAPEGPALVAEAGPELHESRGRFYLHEKPSIVPLKRGDKIYPAEETSRMLADQFRSQELNTVMDRTALTDNMTKNLIASQKQAQFNMNYAIQQQLNMNADRLGGKFNDAIDRLPQTDFFFDEEGFRKRVQKDNSIITYRNARRRF